MKLKKLLAGTAAVCLATSMSLCAVGCGDEPVVNATPKNTDEYIIPQDYCRTYYEVFVRSFADSNGDKIGDLRGLANNLDYLNDGDDSTTTDLGINGIWMMPINMSPSYHKYDVSDYYSIDDEYGTMEDFDYLVSECNKRDIWLQMDLVLNHTSTEHPWFKAAVEQAQKNGNVNVGAMTRYSFVKSDQKPSEAGKWHKVNGTSNYWYLGNFSPSMPDVNLASASVREEITKIVDFWLEKGIRSFRLDAVPWACANSVSYTTENEEFWTWFNEYCNQKGAEVFGKEGDGINAYCYNVGEVWGATPTVNEFFKTKMSNFNYGFGEKGRDGFAGIVNDFRTASQTMESLANIQQTVLGYDENALLSNFLTNHDNDRSAEAMFGGEAKKIKMGAALYLLAPGNPYIYYGEEIGAIGSGNDESKRLAFNWGDKRTVNSPYGADTSIKQRLGSVKSQTNDANSILTYYRNAIKIRNRFPEIGRGLMKAYGITKAGELADISIVREQMGDQPLFSKVNILNETIAAYTLTWNDREVLIVHNVGASTANIKLPASTLGEREIVATLKAKGGNVTLKGDALSLASGTVAVLKVKSA